MIILTITIFKKVICNSTRPLDFLFPERHAYLHYVNRHTFSFSCLTSSDTHKLFHVKN